MKGRKFPCFHNFLFCSVMLLAPCKGGGETRSGPDPEPEPVNLQPVERYPDIDWPLSPQQVRSFFSGSALNLSAEETEGFIREILDASDSLLLSDFIEFRPQISDKLYTTTCDADGCNTAIYDEIVTNTITDLMDTEFSQVQSLMTYQNVSLIQGRGRQNVDGTDIEALSYGGWLKYSFFSAEAGYTPSVTNFDLIVTTGYSIGSRTGTNPVSGSGTWRGVMVGTEVHRGENNGSLVQNFLQGDAELKLSYLYDLEAEVYFTNIRYLDTGNFLDDMSWTELWIEDGRFSGSSDWGTGMVDGYFYGPDHEEAGGIFRSDSIVGAFGVERIPGPSPFPRFPEIPWPVCRECNIDYKEGAEALDLTPTEINDIYEDLGALVESPGVLDDYLPFNNAAEFQILWTYRGVNVAQWRYGDEDVDDGTLIGYGGWLEYNYFGVDVDNLDGDTSDVIPRTYSFGDTAGSNPTAEGGSGTWEGVMTGFLDTSPLPYYFSPEISGDARITISDFINPSVDVTFSFSHSNVTWAGIPLTDGFFETTDDLGEIEGRFYGPNHEEVGGTFIYEYGRHVQGIDKVYGAFGASRID